MRAPVLFVMFFLGASPLLSPKLVGVGGSPVWAAEGDTTPTPSQTESTDASEEEEDEDDDTAETFAEITIVRVWRVHFEGNTLVSDDALNSAVHNKGPKYFWHRWPLFRKNNLVEYDASQLAKDITRIQQRYQEVGHFHVAVETSTRIHDNQKRVDITFTIDEDDPTRLQDYNIVLVAKDLSDADRREMYQEITSRSTLEKGETFALSAYRETQTEIARFSAGRSFAKADVKAKATVDKSDYTADLQLVVALGPNCVFGEITVSGNEKIDTDEIMRQVTFGPGDPFDPAKVKETQERIYDLGYFRTATVRTDVRPGDEGIVDIPITVTERDFRRVRLSVGYGTEEEFRTSASWRKTHFLGGPRIFEVSARYSSLILGGQVDFTQRYWPSYYTTFRQTLLGERETTDAYNLDKYGGRFQFIYDKKQRIPRGIGYSYTRERYGDIKADDIDLQLPPVGEDVWFTHTYLFGFARIDRTDDPFNPSRGYRMFLNTQWASENLGGDVGYWKATYELNGFVPIVGRWILALRSRIGAGQATEGADTIIPGERFYTGGSDTVRGYEYQKVGPLDSDNDPIGGSSLFEANVELRFPLYKDVLGGVVFGDAGYIWQDEFTYEMDDLRYATGLGIRIFTPIGPIRLDYGYKLNPTERDKDDRWRIHFSISHTF